MKTKKVVKDNALINASYNLDLVEQRLILLAIIEVRNSPTPITPLHQLTIQASSYAESFNVSLNAAYLALKDASENLFERKFSYIEKNKKGNLELVKSRWVSEVRYIESEAMVKLSFTPAVTPLITELEAHFTTYELNQVKFLTSSYSIRLYEILISWKNKQQTPVISLEELRLKLGVLEHEYPRMNNFKARILDNSIQQINEHTDIEATYIQHKKGRKITGFSFVIRNKNTHQKNIYIQQNALPGESYSQAKKRLMKAQLAITES